MIVGIAFKSDVGIVGDDDSSEVGRHNYVGNKDLWIRGFGSGFGWCFSLGLMSVLANILMLQSYWVSTSSFVQDVRCDCCCCILKSKD